MLLLRDFYVMRNFFLGHQLELVLISTDKRQGSYEIKPAVTQ